MPAAGSREVLVCGAGGGWRCAGTARAAAGTHQRAGAIPGRKANSALCGVDRIHPRVNTQVELGSLDRGGRAPARGTRSPCAACRAMLCHAVPCRATRLSAHCHWDGSSSVPVGRGTFFFKCGQMRTMSQGSPTAQKCELFCKIL